MKDAVRKRSRLEQEKYELQKKNEEDPPIGQDLQKKHKLMD